jgi:hypothetical protein
MTRTFRRWQLPRLIVRLEFKVADCWIGAYWHRMDADPAPILHIWLCAVPMLPLHLEILPRGLEHGWDCPCFDCEEYREGVTAAHMHLYPDDERDEELREAVYSRCRREDESFWQDYG